MRIGSFVIIVAVIAALAIPAHAGSESACGYDAGTIWEDFGDMFAAPFHLSSDEAVAAAVIGGVTAGFIAFGDDPMRAAATGDKSAFPYVVVHKVAELGRWYGKSNVNAMIGATGLIGVLFAASAIADDDRLMRTSQITLQSYIFTAIVTGATKALIGRDRPYTDSGPHRWKALGFSRSRDHRSFPSGHASSAFAIATAIAKRHPDWWVQAPAYTFATGVGFQRIDDDHHWTSDVIIGATLGYAISAFLVDRHTCDGPESGSTPPVQLTFGFRF